MKWFSSRARVPSRSPYRRPALLGLEILEDRSLLSSGIGVFAPARRASTRRAVLFSPKAMTPPRGAARAQQLL
jgi:hypothetical protein